MNAPAHTMPSTEIAEVDEKLARLAAHRAAWVALRPVTGRTHQLRLHAHHEKGLGIPIVGDPFYGNETRPGMMKLHACELTFAHPETGETLTFRSEPDF